MFSRVATVARRTAPSVRRSAALHTKAVVKGSSPIAFRAALAGAALVAGGVSLTLSGRSPAQCAAATPYTGVPGTAKERSFIAIKPDGVQRGLVGEIISRFEKKGYKLVALKMIWPTEDMASQHYADLKGKPFFPALVKYFASGPICAMVWEGPAVILTGRKMLGATNPNAAEVGSIRGDYCLTMGRNLIHGSDGPDSAKHEIGFWFTEAECSQWPRTLDSWIVADN